MLQQLHPWATNSIAFVLAMAVYNAVGVAQIRLDALRHVQMELSRRRSLTFAGHTEIQSIP